MAAVVLVIDVWAWGAFLADWWRLFEGNAEPWVAIGTILLALATGLLAWQTRDEARASRAELELSRKARQASTRPLLVDAPLGVFIGEWEPYQIPPEGVPPRRLIDRAKIEVSAGATPESDPVGYASISVPLNNVGSGLAIIQDVRLIRLGVDIELSWYRPTLQTAVPPGQLANITLAAHEFDAGDGMWLEAELSRPSLVEFELEVTYSDQ